MNKKVSLIVAVTLLFALLFVACGGQVTVVDGVSAAEAVESVPSGNEDGGLGTAVNIGIIVISLLVGAGYYYFGKSDEDQNDHGFWSIVAGVATAVALFVVYQLLKWMAGIYVDYLWFLDHENVEVFLITRGLPVVLGIAGTLIAFIAFTIVGRGFFSLPQYELPEFDQWTRSDYINEQKEKAIKYRIYWFLVNWILPVFIAVIFGLFAGGFWNEIMLFLNQVPFNQVDPIFGKDFSFYLFSLPFYEWLRWWVFWLVVAVVGICFARTLLIDTANETEGDASFKRFIKVCGVLSIPVVLLLAWGFTLSKYGLLTVDHGSFVGVNYADVHGRIILVNVLAWFTALMVIPITYGLFTLKLRYILVPLGLVLAAAVLLSNSSLIIAIVAYVALTGVTVYVVDIRTGQGRLRGSTFVATGAALLVFCTIWSYPAFVQAFIVGPNELTRELPYIQHHIDHTLEAYGLGELERVEFPYVDSLTVEEYRANDATLQEARAQGWPELLQLNQAFEEKFGYYEMIDTDIVAQGGEVWMSNPREIFPSQVQNPNFVNNHLRFTHGFGMPVADPNKTTRQGFPVYAASGLPTTGESQFIPEKQGIYYGEGTTTHVYVGTSESEVFPPEVEGEPYDGTRGVMVGSGLRRIAIAMKFGSLRLLTSQAIDPESRVLYNRTIVDMVDSLAPFVAFDDDPFMFNGGDQYIWMYDGSVIASNYPYSVQNDGLNSHEEDNFNFIRPAITATIEAYDGEVNLYGYNNNPVLATWMRVFPGLVRPISEMPTKLQPFRRYPYDVYQSQTLIGSYHMSADDFYSSTQVWLPTEEYRGQNRLITSEGRYHNARLPLVDGEGTEEFVLSLGFAQTKIENDVLSRRPNLGGILVARMGDHFGDLVLYEMPTNVQIDTPTSMHQTIKTYISNKNLVSYENNPSDPVNWSDFSMLPIMGEDGRGTLVGVQPLYKTNSINNLPILVQVFIAEGNGAVYQGNTLAQALESFYRGEGEVVQGPAEIPPEPTMQDEVNSSETSMQGQDSSSDGADQCEQYRLDAIAALQAEMPSEAASLTVDYWACTDAR